MPFEYKTKNTNPREYINKIGHILDSESKYQDWFVKIVFDEEYRMGDGVEYCYVYYYSNEVAYDYFVPLENSLMQIEYSDIDFNLIKWLTQDEIDHFVKIGKLIV